MNPTLLFALIASVFSAPAGPQGQPTSTGPLQLVKTYGDWQTCTCKYITISWNQKSCQGSCDKIGTCNDFGSAGVTVGGLRKGCEIVQQLVK